ncbi:MAG: GPW/gp25 family protein [Synergistaceae bacterium]|jgi:phage baseplate assembly protein W|nr:GPW/gp25 family protein [Synergistaceae bacterium]
MWKGPSFPLRAGEYGFFEAKTDEGLIQGNILQILGTRRGERVMLPLFGSRVRELIHEPLDAVTLQLIKVELADAIKAWEPRVVLVSADLRADPQEFRAVAYLRYLLKTTDSGERVFAVNISRTGGVSRWLG